MMIAIQILILTFPTLYEGISDWWRIDKKKKRDTHTKDVYIRIIMIMVLAIANYYLGFNYMVPTAIASSCIFISLFDYFLNLLRGKKWHYLGSDDKAAKWDKAISKWPNYLIVIIRAFILFFGIFSYIKWEWFLSYSAQ